MRTRGKGIVAVIAVLAAATLAAPAQARGLGLVDPAPYRGIGAWVSLYGTEWRNPGAAVSTFAARGATTLYLETGRSTSAAPIDRPVQTAQFVEAAHAVGMKIVAWYYPTFARWSVDAARTLATARFRTPDGDTFDGVAPDIEDPTVRSGALRSARLVAYTNRITSALPNYAWGAITYPPIGLDLNPRAWPAFPWRFVAHRYSAILLMAYWRARTHTPAGAAWYAAGNVAALRVLTGVPDVNVHLIGSGGTTGGEALAFATAALAAGSIGISLYPADQLSLAEWNAMTSVEPSSTS
jgi:hypothetical protein